MSETITLDDLISYILDLTNNNDDSDNESTESEQDEVEILGQWETHNLKNFSENLRRYIEPYEDEHFRCGILTHKTNNISLYYSIQYCLNDEFLNYSDRDKLLFLSELNNKLCNDLASFYKIRNYKSHGWSKKKITEHMTSYNNENIVLLLFADYFNVNLLIFDHDKDVLFAVYPEQEYNVYKPTILLSLLNEIYEPIVNDNKRYYSYCDDIIQMIIDNNSNMIEPLKFNKGKKSEGKEFTVGYENLDNHLEEKKEEPELIVDTEKNHYDDDVSSEISDDEELVITEVDDVSTSEGIFCKIEKETLSVNERMKLPQLQNIAKEFNISIIGGKTKTGKDKMKTKSQLCVEINGNIS